MEALSNPSVLEGLTDDSAVLFAASAELTEVVSQTRAESRRRRREAWELRLRSRATRDHSAALREHFNEGRLRGTTITDVRWFSLKGELAGRAVWALWSGGRLRCHPDLMTQARLLVELGTVFEHDDPPAHVEATVTGQPAAVMMTLARACDRVVNIDFSRESPL